MADRIAALRTMLERNPGDARALFGLAAEYEKRSEWQQVVRHLEQYLDLVEDQGNAWGRLARAYLELGHPDKATTAYQRGAQQARRHGHPSMAAEFDEAIELIDS
jgi:E3 SUMO-protein ligase RanBP2